jgi:thiamine pyrophosphokinase
MADESVTYVVLVLNGILHPDPRLLSILDRAEYLIAADGGANWLAAQDHVPDLLVGDMDSVEPEVLDRLRAQGCRIEQHPAQKDETDAELALQAAIALSPQEITVLGALGGRIDHTLGNLALLAMPGLDGIATYIWDGVSVTWLVTESTEIWGAPGDTVSLIPWGGDAVGIVTEGLAYPLQGETLGMGPSRGISNVLAEVPARVTVQAGRLLVVHTPAEELDSDER